MPPGKKGISRRTKKIKLCTSAQVQPAVLPVISPTSSLSSPSLSSESGSTLDIPSNPPSFPLLSSSATLVGLSSQSSKKRQRLSSTKANSVSPLGSDDEASLFTLDAAIDRALGSDCAEDDEDSQVKAVSQDKEAPVTAFRPQVLPAGYV